MQVHRYEPSSTRPTMPPISDPRGRESYRRPTSRREYDDDHDYERGSRFRRESAGPRTWDEEEDRGEHRDYPTSFEGLEGEERWRSSARPFSSSRFRGYRDDRPISPGMAPYQQYEDYGTRGMSPSYRERETYREHDGYSSSQWSPSSDRMPRSSWSPGTGGGPALDWPRGREDQWRSRTGFGTGASWSEDDDQGHRGRAPKGYRRSDERIREDVNDALTEDRMVDASEIEVEVSNGEVTLSGSVPERRMRRRAEDLVEAASGVSYVQNNLRVTRRDEGESRSGRSGQGQSSSQGSQGRSGQSATAGSGQSGSVSTGSSSSAGSGSSLQSNRPKT